MPLVGENSLPVGPGLVFQFSTSAAKRPGSGFVHFARIVTIDVQALGYGWIHLQLT